MGSQRGGASVTSSQSQRANEAFASYVPPEVPDLDFDSLLRAEPVNEPVTIALSPTADTEADST